MTKTKITFFKLYRYKKNKNTKKFQNIYILNQIHIFYQNLKWKYKTIKKNNKNLNSNDKNNITSNQQQDDFWCVQCRQSTQKLN